MRKPILFMLLTFVVFLCSCQKVSIEETDGQEGLATLTFNISQIEQLDFDTPRNSPTRSTPISSICSRINLVFFQDGKRVKQINQTSADKDFGTLTASIKEGDYQVVILAHSKNENPTLTTADKIVFGNGNSKDFSHGVTDVFLWTKDISVKDDLTEEVKMNRAVGMVRFVSTDSVPNNVGSVRFYYTGGSSTLNALTGLGSVNSNQSEHFKLTSDMRGKPATFDVYTFPKSTESKLRITVSSYDLSSSGTVSEKVFEDIPVVKNQITRYTGPLFKGGTVSGSGSTKFIPSTDDEWKVVDWQGAE